MVLGSGWPGPVGPRPKQGFSLAVIGPGAEKQGKNWATMVEQASPPAAENTSSAWTYDRLE
jgi:hypothetical protein